MVQQMEGERDKQREYRKKKWRYRESGTEIQSVRLNALLYPNAAIVRQSQPESAVGTVASTAASARRPSVWTPKGGGAFCGEFVCSARVHRGLLWVLQLPPTRQRPKKTYITG